MKTKILFLLVGFIIIHGCALQVGLMNPKPNINLSKTNQSLYLALGNDIRDSFTIPEYSTVRNSKVVEWHASLKNGFKNGFGEFYTISDKRQNSDLILKLLKADVKFIPTTVSGYSNTTILKVQIKFKTVLLNSKNEELSKITETAIAQKTINVKGQEDEAVENAIEIMYQIIANKLFNS